MDTLGIKDPIQSLHGTKNGKKPQSQWTKAEKEADEKMVVKFHPHEGTTVGHYSCTIPWRDEKPKVKNNAQQVKMRQSRTTSDSYLEKKGASMDEINAYFQKFEKAGYIEKLDPARQSEDDTYYIPWFPVIDRTRESTKMRIVFDASAKDKEGKTLNGQIEATPNRTNDLLTIILRFRKYKYVVMGDVSEMFLQIKMEEQDQKYHRFFIKKDLWQWSSIIFGENSSPNISQKVLQTNAESQNLELANQAVQNDMYVDDFISSFRKESEVYQTIEEVIKCLNRGGFKMTKFYSNSTKVLEQIPKELLSKKVAFSDKDAEISTSKVLGLTYGGKEDFFEYKSKYEDIEEFCKIQKINFPVDWSKRLILRFSATVYDPPGFICAFTVRARSLLQGLWNEKLEWDDKVADDYSQKWEQWLTELFQLEGLIKIPRHLHLDYATDVKIHVFVDASTTVFGAVAYLAVTMGSEKKVTFADSTVENTGVFSREVDPREVNQEERKAEIYTSIALAKARVTPTKTESVSRLELAACVIGVRLGHTVAKCYDLIPEDIIYWTDSMNCLFWLNKPANILKTFVAHRVGEIQNNSKIENWRHVPTDINPADIPTRAPSIQDLAANQRWWKGPEFLTKEEKDWPPKFTPASCSDEGKTEFKKFLVMAIQMPDQTRLPIPSIEEALDPKRFSVGEVYDGYDRLMKITTAYIRQLHYAIRRRLAKVEVRLHDDVVFREHALKYHLRKAQQDSTNLSELMQQLKTGQKAKNRRYQSLEPIWDKKDSLIRSNSRLRNCKYLKYDTKFPVILDSEGRFTKLLVQRYHKKYGHAVGEETIKAKLRQRYAIIGINQLVTAARTGCKECELRRRKPFSQIMAPLPEYRLETPLRAFAKTGLDFAGPFETKVGRGRARKKVYILVLTCMQIRAIHLEVTDSQDLTAVMNAMSRFVDTRGMPTDILSDNFSTFISEDKELEDWVRHLDSDLLIEPSKAKVKWHLTPPLAPHHGGIYETMVKATKRALKAINKREVLDLDEFRTLVSRCAAIINGRPLKRVVDNASVEILTPNHFLIGNMGGAVTTEHLTPTARWKTINKLQDEYWKLLIENYWHELKVLKKWKIVNPEVRLDQIVVEEVAGIGTGRWKLARVIELIKSSDGRVRKVKIQNANGVYTRAVTSLCPLELD